ncbi:MAG TPA: thiamine phosphate synthase [Vicinamibacterales bacterium]|nr:thiamine phosphate synthase [Vicinamibacterales bacterium]
MRPLLCLVTDRRRLPVVPEDEASRQDALIDQVAAAARAGVDLVQVREPDLEAGALAALVSRAVAAAGPATRIVVNERVDVALAAGAHGVHLRAASMDAARVRGITPPGFLIGRSVHGAAEARRVAAAGGLDYVLLGTVFPSRSKPDGHPVVGTAVLAETVRAVDLPVLAIGGVTIETAAEVAQAGAAGLAAIGLFQPTGTNGKAWASDLGDIVQTLRILFDTTRSASLR